MKRIISIIITLVLAAGMLTGCGGQQTDEPEKLTIVTTIFPEYDWVMEVLGEKAADAEVRMLLDTGVDLHSFQPSAEDIVTVGNCDLFLYVGGESDEWVEEVLESAPEGDRKVLNLLEILGDAVREEEQVEGMEAEEEHEEEHDEEEGPEYDEHVWLSLRNASVIVGAIAEALSEIDAENAQTYRDNGAAYQQKLQAVDEEYSAAIGSAPGDTLLFADRFPFRYFADDYNVNYYAAFAGCSAESEASFETVAFLAGKVDELGLRTVLTLEGSDGKLAETVIAAAAAADVSVLTVDSMQSITAEDVKNGADYLDIMEHNLDVFSKALGQEE